MTKEQIKANALLLLTAAIWGFAFVAQKIGAEYINAFSFNGIRFFLGGISLLPFLWLSLRKERKTGIIAVKEKVSFIYSLKAGICLGVILYLGAGLQQMGMEYTTAAKAGFITGLYIVLVPVFGIFLKQKTNINTWFGVGIAVIGLYLLSINKGFQMENGDFLVLLCSIAFSIHILAIDYFSKRIQPMVLSCIQFLTCAILNGITAVFVENITFVDIQKAIIPILYGGFLSVGVAYTLQVVAQKNAKPSHAAILMSMESVFSCIGGILILKEGLSARGVLGCILIFSAIIISQINFSPKKAKE